ncbi:MAG: hypothetical protein II737_08490 [Mailhella sp.]|nr:hypothetical protein [Mailhella sp.]
MKRNLLALFFACVLAAPFAGAVQAAEGVYLLKDGKAYRADGGTEKLLEGVDVQRADTSAGPWSWIAVDPGQDPEMEGSKSGICFFRGGDARPAGFLPVAEEAASCRLFFSPSGDRLLVSRGYEYIQHLSLYLIDKEKGFVKKASFEVAGPPFWVDPQRFAFSAVDAKKGPRAEGKFDLWWSSAALYDSMKNKLTVLRQATATADYAVTGCDRKSGMLEVMESSVKDVKDWADEDKVDDKELRFPVPKAD